MDADRRSNAEAGRVSAESQAAAEEARIASDAA